VKLLMESVMPAVLLARPRKFELIRAERHTLNPGGGGGRIGELVNRQINI